MVHLYLIDIKDHSLLMVRCFFLSLMDTEVFISGKDPTEWFLPLINSKKNASHLEKSAVTGISSHGLNGTGLLPVIFNAGNFPWIYQLLLKIARILGLMFNTW